MGIKEVTEISAAVLASLGGGGAIVVGLSNFLGKVWADRGLERLRQEYAQLNLKFSDELDRAKRRLQIELDALGHLHKIRTQAEFEKLQDLWEQIATLRDCFRNLPRGLLSWVPPNNAARKEHNTALSQEFVKSYQDVQQFLNAQTLAIPKAIADATDELFNIVRTEMMEAIVCPNPDDIEDRDERKRFFERRTKDLEQFEEEMDALETLMRDYLSGKATDESSDAAHA